MFLFNAGKGISKKSLPSSSGKDIERKSALGQSAIVNESENKEGGNSNARCASPIA
jgi:hypothetical protein